MKLRSLVAAAAAVALAPSVGALPIQDRTPRTPVPKSPVVVRPVSPSIAAGPWAPRYRLVVKFRDEVAARAAGGELVSRTGADLSPARAVAQAWGARFEPALLTPAAALEDLQRRAAERSGVEQPDLGGMLAVVASPGAGESAWSPARLVELGTAFQALDSVEFAHVSTLGVPPPGDIAPPTPDHVPDQDYRGPNPGIDADYALSQGATGSGVRVSDCEYGWVATHEDLVDVDTHPEAGQTVDPSVMSFGWDEHGTAVLGETSAPDNGYGCSGMVPDAEVYTYTEWSVEEGLRRLTAITHAIAASDAGDVVLLEMQSGAGAPAEVDPSIWVVVRAGVDAGVVVVGAAGNGAQNLDSASYSSYQALGDSGAILVGAGTPDTVHATLAFSTYGSRVDVQGWGVSVFTLGYGDAALYGGDGNQAYTFFSGTSSASPFVAAACAALQDLALDHLGGPLAPEDLRQLLIDTGVPQGPGQPIGPLPDLRAAIQDLIASFADLGHGLPGTGGVTPELRGEGVFAPGTVTDLIVEKAASLSPLVLVVGLSEANLPVGGGTLVPAPDLAYFGVTALNGEFALSASTPAVLPPGTPLYFQAWVADLAAPFGASATNGLVGVVR